MDPHGAKARVPTLKFTVKSECNALKERPSINLRLGFVLGGKQYKNTTKLVTLVGKVGEYTIPSWELTYPLKKHFWKMICLS